MKIPPIENTYKAKPYTRSPYCIVVNREQVELVNIETKERVDYKNDLAGAFKAKLRLDA